MDFAKNNQNLPVAFVFEGKDQLPIVKKLFERGQLQLLLPVELKTDDAVGPEALTAVKKKMPGIARHVCPINAGYAKLGEHTCVKCDSKGGVGCFSGHAITELDKFAQKAREQETDSL